MKITFDPVKRAVTLLERGLDFADADEVFAGPQFQFQDMRTPYPEPRFVTYGMLDDRLIVIVWTPTAMGRRIISMRKANEREQRKFTHRLT